MITSHRVRFFVARGTETRTTGAILFELQTKLEDTFGFERQEVVRAIQGIHRVVTVV